MTSRPPDLRGALLALVAFAIYSGHDVVVKALGGLYSPIQIIFFSTLFGFPVITLMLIRDGSDGNLRPRHPWLVLLRTALSVLTVASAFYAFSVLPMAQTYAIIFAAPLLITVLAIPALGETVGWRRALAVLVGLCGVLVVLQPGTTPLDGGHIAALAAAFGSAGAAVIIRKIGTEERSAVLILYPMLASFVVMGVLLPLVYVPMPALHLGATGLIAVLGFVAALLHIAAYRSARAAIVAPMQYSQILWAVVFGALLFGETPSGSTALGGAIIILSGIYIVFREDRIGSKTAPVLRTRSRYVFGVLPRIGILRDILKPKG